jgi:hypothetical protein
MRSSCISQGYPSAFNVALHSVHDEKKEDSLHCLSSASVAVVHLVAPLTALVRPGEVCDRDEEERVAGVCDTGKGVVPEWLLVNVGTMRKIGAEAYQAMNAARIPKAPPALSRGVWGAPVPPCIKYARPSIRNARSRVKKSRKKATVERRVQISSRKVKMNHAIR